MPVFVHVETGDVLHVCPEGMSGANALLTLGFAVQGDQPSPAPVVVEEINQPVPVPADTGRPKATASRKTWAAYAESLGVEPGTLNRGDLIAAVDAL